MEAPTLRVLVTAFAPVPGSSPHAAAVLGMAQALHAEVDLVTLKTDQLSHLEKTAGTRLFRVPVGFGTPLQQVEAFRRALNRQLDAQPYDVVHVRGPLEGLGAIERRDELGFRFVYEVATFPDEAEGADAEAAWAQAHARCLEVADLVLVPTQAAERSLGERGHAGKAMVVSPGVDVATLDWWPSAPSETARLLYLGTFGADRDLATMFGAVKLVSRRMPVRMLVAGDPDHERRQRVRRMVDAFGVGELVEVRGEPRPETIPALIAAADLCMAPAAATPRFQDWGDLPQPLLEYFACGRPVIAAGVPGVAEVMRDEQEGLLYPPGDDSTYADAIETMLSDRPLREKVVQAAYDRVRRQFSGGARRRRIAEVYEALVPGSQRWDAWAGGFENESTGLISVPSLRTVDIGETTGERTTAPPPSDPDTGENAAMSGSTGAFDTNPGLDTGDAGEIASQPTQKLQIDTLPGVLLETGQHRQLTPPEGTRESDTSPRTPSPKTPSPRTPSPKSPSSPPPAKGSAPPPAPPASPNQIALPLPTAPPPVPAPPAAAPATASAAPARTLPKPPPPLPPAGAKPSPPSPPAPAVPRPSRPPPPAPKPDS